MVEVAYKGELQDKIKSILLGYGQKEISVTLDDLIGKTGFNSSQIYQTLYRLQSIGEIKLLKEDDSNPRSKVVGVELLRMEPIEQISERNQQREVAKKTQDALKMAVIAPNLLGYVNKRLAVERARESLKSANLDPDTVLKFEPDPLGEEAILLYDRLEKLTRENLLLQSDVEAEKRNAEHYKQQLSTRTYGDSGT